MATRGSSQQESIALLFLFVEPDTRSRYEAAGRADIMVVIAAEVRAPRGALPRRELRSFVREACAAIPLAGEVSVLLTTDAAVQELNKTFRRKNKPTDVLSFPAAPLPGETQLAGDLAISIDTAARQAAEYGHTLLLEVKILLLHGLLHLAGFDHEQDTGQMRRREQKLRAQFALPAGLIHRAGQAPADSSAKTSVLTAVANSRAGAAERGRAPAKRSGRTRKTATA